MPSGRQSFASSSTPASRLVAQSRVLVIAHRGGAGHQAPENTLPAFRLGVQARADLVELDYHHSSDGVPIVMHGKTLDRTTNATRLWGKTDSPVESHSFAELRKLDAGSWFSSQYAGVKIPTLAEALDAIGPNSTTLIERKAGDPATCIKLLTDKRLLDHVVVQAFDWQYLAECHKLAPALTLGGLGRDEFTEKKLDQFAPCGLSFVGWLQETLDRRAIAAIHNRGWKAWTFTVNDPRRAAELAGSGINGIITDQPEAIRSVLAARRTPEK